MKMVFTKTRTFTKKSNLFLRLITYTYFATIAFFHSVQFLGSGVLKKSFYPFLVKLRQLYLLSIEIFSRSLSMLFTFIAFHEYNDSILTLIIFQAYKGVIT